MTGQTVTSYFFAARIPKPKLSLLLIHYPTASPDQPPIVANQVLGRPEIGYRSPYAESGGNVEVAAPLENWCLLKCDTLPAHFQTKHGDPEESEII